MVNIILAVDKNIVTNEFFAVCEIQDPVTNEVIKRLQNGPFNSVEDANTALNELEEAIKTLGSEEFEKLTLTEEEEIPEQELN